MPDKEPEIAARRAFRPADIPIKDAAIGKEPKGLVHKKATAQESSRDAKTPPLNDKPIPTSSIAERLRERLKKER